MNLVTGATGHIGNVLVRELLAEGKPVRAMVLPRETTESIDDLGIEKVEGNVLEPESLARAMEDVEYVYHLAGIVAIMPGSGQLMQRVNVEGARNVAKAALDAGVKRMVHTSSIHAFKRMPHGVVIDEEIPFTEDGELDTYDRTKAEGAKAVLGVAREGLDVVVACPTGVIGPHDYMGSEMGQTLLDFAKNKLHILVSGAYDFVDVRDVAKGLTLACQRGRSMQTYILSGAQIKVTALRKLVQTVANIRTPEIVLPFEAALAMAYLAQYYYRLTKAIPRFTPYSIRTLYDNSVISNARAKRELGYDPRPMTETVRDTLNWWKARKSPTSI